VRTAHSTTDEGPKVANSFRPNTGAAFFWDGLMTIPVPVVRLAGGRPVLSGGWPKKMDLLIWDVPFSHPDQLAAITERHRPTHLLLVDEACSAASHPAYSWVIFPTYALGTLR